MCIAPLFSVFLWVHANIIHTFWFGLNVPSSKFVYTDLLGVWIELKHLYLGQCFKALSWSFKDQMFCRYKHIEKLSFNLHFKLWKSNNYDHVDYCPNESLRTVFQCNNEIFKSWKRSKGSEKLLRLVSMPTKPYTDYSPS